LCFTGCPPPDPSRHCVCGTGGQRGKMVRGLLFDDWNICQIILYKRIIN
jgi:hypothetical protein